MSRYALNIPEYILEGVSLFKNAKKSAEPTTDFNTLYAKGVMPLVVAQKNLQLTDHGLGSFEDQNGVVWVLEGGTIYRVSEDA